MVEFINPQKLLDTSANFFPKSLEPLTLAWISWSPDLGTDRSKAVVKDRRGYDGC
jgi:hypothetical protein